MTVDIINFLNARHDEAEADTRKLLYWAQQTILTLQDPKLLGKHIPGWHDWPNVERICAARLTEIDAERRALALHKRVILNKGDGAEYYVTAGVCITCGGSDAAFSDGTPAPRAARHPCPTLRLLTLPYAEHPDYRDEWRPA